MHIFAITKHQFPQFKTFVATATSPNIMTSRGNPPPPPLLRVPVPGAGFRGEGSRDVGHHHYEYARSKLLYDKVFLLAPRHGRVIFHHASVVSLHRRVTFLCFWVFRWVEVGGLLVSVFSPFEQPFKQGGAVGFLVGVVLYLLVRLRRFCFDQVGSDSKSLEKINK